MLACCGSQRFAQAMAAAGPIRRPTPRWPPLMRPSASLTWPDVLEAMDRHPRIGARAGGQSAAEQSGVADATRAALAVGNAEYEDRFGHVFLICATGLTGDQMLGALRERLKNNADIERTVAATELRMITRLRVAKALAS